MNSATPPAESRVPATGAAWPNWLKVLGVVVLVPAGVILWVWNGPGGVHQPPLRPFELVRAPGAEWPPLPIHGEDGEDDPGLRFSVEIGSTHSRTNTSITRVVSSRGGARLASRSLLVVAESDDDITAAVTWRVLAALQQDPVLERITCMPRGTALPAPAAVDRVAPDLVLRIDNPNAGAEASGERVRIEARLMDQLQRQRTMRTSGKGRGCVEFALQVAVESTQTFDGIATRSARFDSTTEALASSLSSLLLEDLARLRTDHGVLPPLPAEFYPEYRPASDLAAELADVAPLALAGSWRGVFLHNESWWRGVVPLAEAAAMTRLRERLIEQGFELVKEYDENAMAFSRGDERLLAFVEAKERRRIGSVVVEQNTAATPIALRLHHRAAAPLVRRAIETTLSDDGDLALLSAFRGHWDDAQERRALTVLQERAHEPEHLLLRSSIKAADGEEAGAIADLRRAWLLASVEVEAGDLVEDVEEAMKKLGHIPDNSPPTAEELEDLGFLELESREPVEYQVAPGQPLRAWFDPGGNEARIACVGIRLQRNDEGELRVAMRTAHSAGAHETSDMRVGGFTTGLISGGTLRCEVLDDPGDGVATIRLTAQRGP